MKEYFVLSDIHSFYKQMMLALEAEGFDINNPDHIVITCGDNLDRGPSSEKVLDFLYSMHIQNRAHLVRGNHEDLFEEMIKRGDFHQYDESNGTLKTLAHLQNPRQEYAGYDFDFCSHNYDKRWDELRQVMINFYETPNHVFVHAWIPFNENKRTGKISYNSNWRNASEKEWYEARWVNGVQFANEFNIIDHEKHKTIVCGHWHCSYGNVRKKYPDKPYHFYKFEEFSNKDYLKPYYDEEKKVIAIDACTAFSGICNCLHFTEETI